MPIQDKLIRLISTLGDGNRLPPERELATRYAVSRGRLRTALSHLEGKGLISRRPKIGTVVVGDVAAKLTPTVYISRKPLEEMPAGSLRYLRNSISRDFDKAIAKRSNGFQLESIGYVNDPVKMRLNGRPTVSGTMGTALPEMIAHNLCEDLTDRISAWSEAAELHPNLRESVTFQQRQYALPTSAHVFVLFCNTRLMRQAGLDPLRTPQTWAELLETAKNLTDAEAGRWGLGIPMGYRSSWLFSDLCRQAGGSVLANDDDSWSPSFQQAPGLKTATWLRDLRWKHQVLPPQELNGDALMQLFFENRLGMCIMESGAALTAIARSGCSCADIEPAPLPAGPDGHSLCQVSISATFINAWAPKEEKDAGWEYLKATCSRQAQCQTSRELWKHGIVRAWPSIYRNIIPRETGVDLPEHWFRVIERCIARAVPEPGGLGWNSELFLGPVLRRLFNDPQADPREELEHAARLARPGIPVFG